MLILGLKGLSESLTICDFGPLTQKKKTKKKETYSNKPFPSSKNYF